MTYDSELLYVLGDSRWLEWIEPFLGTPGCVVRTLVQPAHNAPSAEELVNQITSLGCRSVVFISHHNTVLSDAVAAATLEAMGQFCTVAHPVEVAKLAYDKRAMASIARGIPDLDILPEFNLVAAQDFLQSSEHAAVVIKENTATEGISFRLARSAAELELGLASDGLSADHLLQPFLFGEEYSVDVLADGPHIQIYEPVFKSRTELDWCHPAARTRLCPHVVGRPSLRRRLLAVAAEYAKRLSARGVLELEFLVDDAERIWFLELNPRLAATMRMVCAASVKNIFLECGWLAYKPLSKTELIPTRGYTAEFPQRERRLELADAARLGFSDYWVSSRVTVFAHTPDELAERLVRVNEYLSHT